MKLTYRGVRYNPERNHSRSAAAVTDTEIVDRDNSPKAIINPRFPWIKYIKQLLPRPESKPVYDPIAFWYNHKREFIRDCWYLTDAQKLNLAWDLTLKIERAKALKSKQKTKLKYRGVTYYR